MVALPRPEAVVRVLVLWALSGEKERIEAARMYFIDNMSPSDIAAKVGASKNVVNGWLGRLKSENGNSLGLDAVLRSCYNRVMEVPSILVLRPEGYSCVVCKRKRLERTAYHILWRHRELLEEHTAKVIENCLKKNRSSSARRSQTRPDPA